MIKMTERKRPDVIDEVIRFMEHVPGATTSLYGGLNPNDIKVEREVKEMKCCRNCKNQRDIEYTKCKKCNEQKSQWEWDGTPSVCDGCASHGKFAINKGLCRGCVDGDKWKPLERVRKMFDDWDEKEA